MSKEQFTKRHTHKREIDRVNSIHWLLCCRVGGTSYGGEWPVAAVRLEQATSPKKLNNIGRPCPAHLLFWFDNSENLFPYAVVLGAFSQDMGPIFLHLASLVVPMRNK